MNNIKKLKLDKTHNFINMVSFIIIGVLTNIPILSVYSYIAAIFFAICAINSKDTIETIEEDED